MSRGGVWAGRGGGNKKNRPQGCQGGGRDETQPEEQSDKEKKEIEKESVLPKGSHNIKKTNKDGKQSKIYSESREEEETA
jgi:hypothetical protein